MLQHTGRAVCDPCPVGKYCEATCITPEPCEMGHYCLVGTGETRGILPYNIGPALALPGKAKQSPSCVVLGFRPMCGFRPCNAGQGELSVQ